MNIAITLIIRGQRDDGIKALEFIRDKNHMFVPKEKRDLQDEFSYFTRQLSGHLQALLSILIYPPNNLQTDRLTVTPNKYHYENFHQNLSI